MLRSPHRFIVLALLGLGGSGLCLLASPGHQEPSRGLQARSDREQAKVELPRWPKPLGVAVGADETTGATILANCSTCHATRSPDASTREGADLSDFHQGLQMAHGGLSCLSCHDDRDYRQFRLADGTSVAPTDVMQLCAQCHGPQFRDYRHGSHGGQRGHFDARFGPIERKHCLHCHDPHAPAFPKIAPVLPPRDRFLPAPGHDSETHTK